MTRRRRRLFLAAEKIERFVITDDGAFVTTEDNKKIILG